MSSSSSLFFIICGLLLMFGIERCRSATELCHPDDKKVLMKMKKLLGGLTIFDLPTWKPETDCCHHWHGVTCDFDTHRVVSLSFYSSNAPAFIPDDIGDLPYLTQLSFHKLSNFTGTIPYSITKLKNLSFLTLDWCGLTGTIPGFLSKLKKLTFLNLSFNNLTGPIPSSLSDISGLSYLILDRNQLTGTIPESLVKLKDNQLYLLLSHNELSGEIPASFRDIDFRQIELSRNNLRGDISMLFGPNKTTNFMYFDRNMFEFNMSELELHPTLKQLDISHNQIYGGLPSEMINLEWQFLNVSYNRMCGPIPQGGRLQTSFDYSTYFHNRCLCGSPLNVTCRQASPTEDCTINGFHIPAKTRVFVNVWDLGRDPNYWENPNEFWPDQFINGGESSKVDVRGQNFEFLPFRSGRRTCPGASLAMLVVQTTLAAMVQCFEWKVVDGGVDMEEDPGMTLPRAHPVMCVPVARFNIFPLE